MQRTLQHFTEEMQDQEIHPRRGTGNIHVSEQRIGVMEQRKRQSEHETEAAKRLKGDERMMEACQAETLASEVKHEARDLEKKLQAVSIETIQVIQGLGEAVCDCIDLMNQTSLEIAKVDEADGMIDLFDEETQLKEMEELCEEAIELDKRHLDFIDSIDKAIALAGSGDIAALMEHAAVMERLHGRLSSP